MEFEIGSNVFHGLFSTHNVTRFDVKDKLVLRCVGNNLRREAFLVVWLVLVLHSKFRDEISFKEGRM